MKTKRRIQAEDLYRLELVSGARISPDGKHVVYAQMRVDQKTEKKYKNLWIVPTEGGDAHQFTFGDQSDAGPKWSPDGSQIAFLSNRGDKEKPAQIYLIPFCGGEARPLTRIEGAINSFQWSPDGKSILCTVNKTDKEEMEREKDENKKKLGVVARHYDRVFYKLDGAGYLPHEREHLWMVDAKTGKAKQLTDHAVYDEGSPTFTPDGKSILFVSNRSENPDFFVDRSDLFIMPAAGGEFKRIELPVGNKSHPSVSPDGKWLAYTGSEGENVDYKNASLFVVPLDGSSAPRNLTEQYDIHVSSWTINDLGEPEEMNPTWSLDSQTLYFQEAVHGKTILRSIDRSGKNLKSVIDEPGVVGSYTFDKSQTRLAYFFGTMQDPNQIMVRDMKSGKSTQITQLNQSLLAGIDLGNVREVWYKGPDGNDLQGWIMTPPDFDPKKKYPSILEIHGGPQTQYGFYFMHEFYYLASKDYVVYFTNPRGGRGYGEAHTRAIWQDWGKNDYADLMTWADLVSKEPYMDATRMGVTGGSYGGYMTVWIIGHTQRFKAAVTQRCVSNFVSMWGSSDFNWVFERELSNKAPFEDLETYWDHSPMKYIGNAKTPTLVIHNEFDLRCPIEQGEQVFVALKRKGVDSEFVRFPDEFHGLSRTGRTDRRIARLNHILGWFETRLK